MKKTLAILFAVFCCITANAQEINAVVTRPSDGNQNHYQLSSNPNVVLGNDNTITFKLGDTQQGQPYTLTGSNTYTVLFSSVISSEVNENNLTVSHPILIQNGGKLNVSGTMSNNDAQDLVIEDGGQLKVYDNGAKDAVQATVLKNITGYGGNDNVKTGWNFIASPITEEYIPASPMTSNNYDLYRLNPSNTMWENNKDNEGHTNTAAGFKLTNGKGYLYANSNDITLSFAGTIKPFTTAGNANQVALADGWNLVGNPYTFNVYSSKSYYTIVTENGENVIKAVSVASGAIAPCTGIVIESAGDDYVAFLESAASWSTGNQGNIQLTLAQQTTNRGNANIDNVIVSFNEGSELEKFYFIEQNASLYIPQGNEEYAIVSSNGQGEMPVNFKAAQNGTYTLSIEAENVEMDYLHLIDNMTGADVDLLQTPSYSFTSKTTDYASRFRLVFSANNVNDDSTSSETFAFINGEEIVITNAEADATLQVVDMTGRILVNTKGANRLSTAGMTQGVYVIRLVNGEKVKTQKIVVR